jgi:hypothetical protein
VNKNLCKWTFRPIVHWPCEVCQPIGFPSICSLFRDPGLTPALNRPFHAFIPFYMKKSVRPEVSKGEHRSCFDTSARTVGAFSYLVLPPRVMGVRERLFPEALAGPLGLFYSLYQNVIGRK